MNESTVPQAKNEAMTMKLTENQKTVLAAYRALEGPNGERPSNADIAKKAKMTQGTPKQIVSKISSLLRTLRELGSLDARSVGVSGGAAQAARQAARQAAVKQKKPASVATAPSAKKGAPSKKRGATKAFPTTASTDPIVKMMLERRAVIAAQIALLSRNLTAIDNALEVFTM